MAELFGRASRAERVLNKGLSGADTRDDFGQGNIDCCHCSGARAELWKVVSGNMEAEVRVQFAAEQEAQKMKSSDRLETSALQRS